MIRVFIGTHAMHTVAEAVLQYSIRKNTDADVDITLTRDVISWQTPPTGFSSHRYMVPRLCNYKGFAIYLDVDMLVLGDIDELWAYQEPGKWCITSVVGKGGVRDEVSVIDCSAFKDLPSKKVLCSNIGKRTAKGKIGPRYLKNIPNNWNAKLLPPCSKGFCAERSLGCTMPKKKGAGPSTGHVNLLHYTRLDTQPWQPNKSEQYLPFPCKRTEALFWQYHEEATA